MSNPMYPSRINQQYPVPAPATHQYPPMPAAQLPPPPNAMLPQHMSMPQLPQHQHIPQIQQQQPPQPQHPVQHPQPAQHAEPAQAGQVAPQGQAVAQALPPPYEGTHEGRIYRLVVEQQPVRARMCGFGDKDRRPITPPPCIRLVIIDAATKKELNVNDVESAHFVLMVDLWHDDATRAVNLVRHNGASPSVSISSSSTTSYPPPPDRTMYMAAPQYPQFGQGYGHMPNQFYGAGQAYPPYPASNAYGQGAMSHAIPVSMSAPANNQNHTRNLIGMNAVNATRLNDPKGQPGFWFVLQDLSVRTEGSFRLKLSMTNVGVMKNGVTQITVGKAPILASVFSEVFHVYSAKKFPGVIESTELSKCFASQGIKIPIRKDAPKALANQDEYDQDDADGAD